MKGERGDRDRQTDRQTRRDKTEVGGGRREGKGWKGEGEEKGNGGGRKS